MAFAAGFDVAKLNGSNGFRFPGSVPEFVRGSAAGDIDGDGIDDLVTHGLYSDGNSSRVLFGPDGRDRLEMPYSSLRSAIGLGDVNGDGIDDLSVSDYNSAYVIFGSTTGLGATVELGALDGSDGFRLDGAGDTVASAGDVNGDGLNDLVIGGTGKGVYLLFGSASGFAPVLRTSVFNGATGFRLSGLEGLGRTIYLIPTIDGAGDVNGDGLDDLIIGAPYTGSAGAAYVIFGSAGGFARDVDVAALDGSDGFRIEGVGPGNATGRSVSGAGDVNGDGVDDIIVAAPSANTSYVIFGTKGGYAPVFDLGTIDASTGLRIDGKAYSVDGGGDIDGDGTDDLLIGSFVVFGSSAGFADALSLSELDGTDGFRIFGSFRAFNEYGPTSFSAHAGDINGDGLGDVAVEGSEQGFLIFGFPPSATAAPDLTGDLALTVDEGGKVALTPADVAATDAGTAAAELTFAVSEWVNGVVVRATNPYEDLIATFTQAELTAGEIAFVHDGSETTTASFVLTVSNDDGFATAPHTVRATVVPDSTGPPPIPDAPGAPERQPGSRYLDNDGDIRFLPFPGTQYTDADGDIRFRPVGEPYYDVDGDLRYDEGHYARDSGPARLVAPASEGGDDDLQFIDLTVQREELTFADSII